MVFHKVMLALAFAFAFAPYLTGFIPENKLYLAETVFEASQQYPCVTNCESELKCIPSAWDKAAEYSKILTDGCGVVLYSIAVSAKADEFNEIPDYWDQMQCSVLFLSAESDFIQKHPGVKKIGNWHVVSVQKLDAFSNNRKAAKIPKLFPQSFFANSVNYALYIDAKIQLLNHPALILDEHFLPFAKANTILTMVGHGSNNNIRQEVMGIAAVRKQTRPNITYDYYRLLLQRDTYASLNVTGDGHFVDTAIMMHNLKSKASLEFSCAWQRQLQKYSDRDQISLQGVIGWFSRSSTARVGYDNYIHSDEQGTVTVDLNVTGDLVNLHIIPAYQYNWSKGTKRFSILKRFKWNK